MVALAHRQRRSPVLAPGLRIQRLLFNAAQPALSLGIATWVFELLWRSAARPVHARHADDSAARRR